MNKFFDNIAVPILNIAIIFVIINTGLYGFYYGYDAVYLFSMFMNIYSVIMLYKISQISKEIEEIENSE